MDYSMYSRIKFHLRFAISISLLLFLDSAFFYQNTTILHGRSTIFRFLLLFNAQVFLSGRNLLGSGALDTVNWLGNSVWIINWIINCRCRGC